MLDTTNKLAVVTGASTGIGFELAKECSRNGFHLIIAANEREIEDAKAKLGITGNVQAVEANLATVEGVDALYRKINGPSG